ncbi:hypothetical protein GGX14DRAFT_474046 [Mycena pura]|uniref:Helicase C-terminal domain-containing protein n=1 Tax=Mycena pura TaxID=153505 RepID=A0AAD6UWG5_9AGAR|nr:hypothetical protein GGX14DRAFT_474046 [Mycena pura]
MPLTEKFGCLTEIPNAPHIIVMPPNLQRQWLSEFERFFLAHRVQCFIIRTSDKFWAADIAAFVASPHPPIRKIVLVTSRILQRMAAFATHPSSTGPGARARVLFPLTHSKAKGKSVFEFSWLTAIYDEVHEARTGQKLWQAFDLLNNLALVKIHATATPYIESAKDVFYLAVLGRMPGLGFYREQQLRARIATVQKFKNYERLEYLQAIQQFTAGDLSAQMTPVTSSSRQATPAGRSISGFLTPTASTSSSPASPSLDASTAAQGEVQIATSAVVKGLQAVLAMQTLRRTGTSIDDKGDTISISLPLLTVLHVGIKLSPGEVENASLFEQDALKKGEPHAAISKLESARLNQFKAFYIDARQYIALPCGHGTRPLTMEKVRESGLVVSKLSALAELCKLVLLRGPENVVPRLLHGDSTKMVGQSTLGIPVTFGKNYVPKRLPPDSELRPGIQIIVVTMLVLFQDILCEFLTSHGIKNLAINGSVSLKERNRIIERFKADATYRVLFMSPVGQVGLNLTNASVMIHYEVNWSSVMSYQSYGRIYRPGQTLPTFAFQLVAEKTVDVLLATLGLRKLSLAKEFSTIDRAPTFWTQCISALADIAKEQDQLEVVDEQAAEAFTHLEEVAAQEELARRRQARQQSKAAKNVERAHLLPSSTTVDGEGADDAAGGEEASRGKRKAKKGRVDPAADSRGARHVPQQIAGPQHSPVAVAAPTPPLTRLALRRQRHPFPLEQDDVPMDISMNHSAADDCIRPRGDRKKFKKQMATRPPAEADFESIGDRPVGSDRVPTSRGNSSKRPPPRAKPVKPKPRTGKEKAQDYGHYGD